jgi:hypothetical protein
MNRKRDRKYRSQLYKRKAGAFWRLFRDRVKKGNPLQTADFYDIENSPSGINEIQNLARQAGLAAASEAKAIGIPKVFARGNEIIREYADGHIEVLVEGTAERTFFRRLNFEILHARKK